MKIIVSPAKKMKTDVDSLEWTALPMFISEAKTLCSKMQEMAYDELKKLWKCNDKIASLNFERLLHMDLENNLTPAILAYEGIQYQYMAPGVFSTQELEYIQDKLRILSGFYGFLRPFDGIVPYRLEMQAKLSVSGTNNLYDFWGNKLASALFSETDCVINLASKEYSLCITKHLPENMRFVTCMFAEEINGIVVEKGTKCKMARGEMVRFMAENNVGTPEEIKAFDRLRYSFSKELSTKDSLVFLHSK